MRRVAAAVAAAASLGCGADAAAQQGAAASGPFGWFGSLAGACWRGEHPNGKSSDTQCYENQYGRFIRGTIRVFDDKGTVLTEGDSVYAPDAKTRRVLYSQWANNGTYGTGEIQVDGAVLRFVNRAPDGSEVKLRFSWSRSDADSYRVARERRQDDGSWKEEFAVVYHRVAR